VGGLYYFKEHVKESAATPFTNQWNADGTAFTLRSSYGTSPAAAATAGWEYGRRFIARASRADAESYAAYGQGTYTPAGLDKLHLTVGGRYTNDKRNGVLYTVNAKATNFLFTYNKSRFDPLANVAYDLTDTYLFALDAAGAPLWVRRLSVPGNSTAPRALANGPLGGVWLAGRTTRYLVATDSFDDEAELALFAADGTERWQKALGYVPAREAATGVAALSGDRAAFAVSAVGYLDVPGASLAPRGQEDVVLLRADAEGTIDVALRAGDGSSQIPAGLASLPTDELLLTGTFGGARMEEKKVGIINCA
jgi:hypothetical protein